MKPQDQLIAAGESLAAFLKAGMNEERISEELAVLAYLLPIHLNVADQVVRTLEDVPRMMLTGGREEAIQNISQILEVVAIGANLFTNFMVDRYPTPSKAGNMVRSKVIEALPETQTCYEMMEEAANDL